MKYYTNAQWRSGRCRCQRGGEPVNLQPGLGSRRRPILAVAGRPGLAENQRGRGRGAGAGLWTDELRTARLSRHSW